jgi:hypothetical protein
MFDLYRGPRGSTKCNFFIFKTHSAKIRAGPPKDDKNDLNDEVTTAKTWTGVIPGVFPLHITSLIPVFLTVAAYT